MNEVQRAKIVLRILNKTYPTTPIPLKHRNIFTLLISVLLFPLTTPVIIAATKSTEFIFNQRPIGEWSFWLLILITISTVFCLTGYILFNYFIEE